ncbi:hypothetical protein [Conexibacter sp. SYSU D00693]|uniref:hypothetical protein n=1 Tax=Conexibacter sp. SYSU D00693 TaxID=2812560 RepID=UPI00196A60A6|nr:hypothetical protein [Conexibacter sp. SYSU D00693]
MSDRDPALEPFDALIGTWELEATHPAFDGVMRGEMTFEWLAGGKFLVQRSHNDEEIAPDTISVIGPPEEGEGLVQEYFDSRGVRRTYGVSLDDGVLRFWRHHPGFEQRFEARIAPDAFDGLWQLAQEPGVWKDDLAISLRRRS